MNSSKLNCSAMLLACLQVACAATSQPLTTGGVDGAANLRYEADKCPSQDFPTFLKRFSDTDDASIRARFTADPVAYEVLFYTVAEPDKDSPEMFVSEKRGANRLKFFSYRYFPSSEDYDRIDQNGEPYSLQAMQAGNEYPLQITVTEGDGRKVIFGLEYEIDVYEFERAEDCWRLTRIINPRD